LLRPHQLQQFCWHWLFSPLRYFTFWTKHLEFLDCLLQRPRPGAELLPLLNLACSPLALLALDSKEVVLFKAKYWLLLII
jgi:hypothetical protein